MTMKALCRLLASLCFGTSMLIAAPSALAQKSVPPAPDSLAGSAPKDVHTRAKMHTELGSLYFQDGNLIVALEELTMAISINPNYAQAYSTRGLVLYYIKEIESADKDFRKALELDNKDPEISNNYGWFLCQIGREKESIAYFQRAIKNPLYQTPETAYLNAGTCFIKLGDLDSAEEYIGKNLRLNRENPQALYELAVISYKQGNYDAAKKRLLDVVRLTDPSAETLWLFVKVSRRLGESEPENSYTAQLRRKYPESPEYKELLQGKFE
jgi:type IV pilus assembly protein PilF